MLSSKILETLTYKQLSGAAARQFGQYYGRFKMSDLTNFEQKAVKMEVYRDLYGKIKSPGERSKKALAKRIKNMTEKKTANAIDRQLDNVYIKILNNFIEVFSSTDIDDSPRAKYVNKILGDFIENQITESVKIRGAKKTYEMLKTFIRKIAREKKRIVILLYDHDTEGFRDSKGRMIFSKMFVSLEDIAKIAPGGTLKTSSLFTKVIRTFNKFNEDMTPKANKKGIASI